MQRERQEELSREENSSKSEDRQQSDPMGKGTVADVNMVFMFVGYFKRKQKNPQAHGYQCSFHLGVFQSIDFPHVT